MMNSVDVIMGTKIRVRNYFSDEEYIGEKKKIAAYMGKPVTFSLVLCICERKTEKTDHLPPVVSGLQMRVFGGRSKYEVYVGGVPLRAAKGPPQLILSAAYKSLSLWDLQHFIVILKPQFSPSQPTVFDFQPEDPENLFVALTALSGKEVKGVIFERKLMKLPKRKCWFVGHSAMVDAIAATRKFNENWDTNLKIGSHDCRDYTNGLVEYLTGEQCVLEHLRTKQEK